MTALVRAAAVAALVAGTAGADAVVRVQPGDTLWAVARAHGTTVARLLDLNPRPAPTLRVGEVLRVPDAPRTAVPSRAPARPAVAGRAQVGHAVYYPGRRDARTVMTAAHLTLPKGTWVRVTHRVTGRSVDVLINDRGPFGVPSRIVDVSTAAAARLGILREGVAPVTLVVLARP